MAEYFIDAKGLQCPGPITQLFKQMKEAQSGDIITIEVTDSAFKRDVESWCKKTKNELLELKEENGIITAKIKKI
ncbi:sulfurtransferase TusA family protein [Caldicellulosiruptor obsidiansis]|uniref:sulfurtransferase TusA family protein n=1 Tax=Caldicellulosiruptor obsidiansis TaxID=717609 RepID=UPI0002E8CB7A|nr:sulfurtransferase TusA family protein [Caldicellulosiruptor obsidiansis]